MKHWPKSAYLALAILTILYGLFSVWLYRNTVVSYSSVGFNNGKIQQSMETMAIIQKSVHVTECNKLRNDEDFIELLRVKAERIDMVIAQDNSVRFCQY